MYIHISVEKVSAPPRLVWCATLWSMVGQPARREWSLPRKFAEIARAGFDGVVEMYRPEFAPHLARHGLALCGRVFSRHGRDTARLLRIEAAGGARYVNCMLGRHDQAPAEAVPLIARVLRQAQRLGLEAHVETHRDTCTETPEKIVELARRYEDLTGHLLPLTWDHSHLAVVKHLEPTAGARRLLAETRLIQHSRLFHCRPFASQHAQVPVTDGRDRLTPEFRDYLGFAEELFTVWLRGPQPRGELWVCPELGAVPGYHLSVHPPVWPDAVRCRDELDGAWRRALRRVR